MAVAPADKRGRAIVPRLVLARYVQGAIEGRADAQHDGIVNPAQLGKADVSADLHVAVIAHLVTQCGALEFRREFLDRVMVRRDTVTYQPERGRQALMMWILASASDLRSVSAV